MIQHESKSSPKAKLKNTARQVKDDAAQAVSDVTDQAGSAVHKQKNVAADRIGAVSHAIRQAASNLKEDEHAGGIGYYAEQAADQVDHLSQYLREHELSDVLGGIQSWARRNPALFLGGCFIAGLLVARFLKSSAEGSSAASFGRRNPYASIGSQEDDFGDNRPSSSSSASSRYGSQQEGLQGGLSHARQAFPGSGPTSRPQRPEASWENEP